MGTHLRRQIREAAVSTLTGLTTTGNRVYGSRVHGLPEHKLPALCVYALSEEVETVSMRRPTAKQVRALLLAVEAYAKATADVENVMDAIASEVEAAMFTTPANVLPLVKSLDLESTELQLSGEGDQPVTSMRMTFQATYHTVEGDPDTAV